MASKKAGRAAGLAALAGLAYMASRGKDGKESKSAPDRDDADTYTGSRASKAEDATESGDFLSRRLNRMDTEDGKAYSTNNLSPMSSGKSASATRTPAAPRTTPSSSGAKGPISGDAFDNERTGGDARLGRAKSGSGGPLSGEAFNNTPARNPGGVGKRGGASSGNVSPSAKMASSDEDGSTAMSRIPGSSPAGWQGGEGEQVDSTELGRNVNAALMGRGTGLSTLGKIGAEAATAKGALARAAEAKRIKDAINGGAIGYKKGGAIKKMASGGMTSSASNRGDGIASKGKTRCKMY